MNDLSCSIILDNQNKELNLKGTPAFPVAIYNDDLTASAVPYHWHDEIELIVVVCGEMEIIVECEKFTLKEGEGIFINSERLHSCVNFNDTHCIIKSFVFHSRFLYGELTSAMYEKYFYPLLLESTSNTSFLSKEECKLVLNAYDIFENKAFAYEFFVRENLTKVLIEIIQKIENKPKQVDVRTQKMLSRCKLMMAFINENFSNDITLLDIANSANIKEREALRCFNSVLSTSPIKFLKSFRLEKSAFLLKNSCEPIIEIGLSCGFSEMSYFSKSFKEMYKMTPTEYRNS